jgi:hypothetical protein
VGSVHVEDVARDAHRRQEAAVEAAVDAHHVGGGIEPP